MLLNNYQIPKNITTEEEFMYDITHKLWAAGSHHGFALGDIIRLIERMKELNVSTELVEQADNIFDCVNAVFQKYIDIYDFSRNRWEELGEPLSSAAHQVKKKKLNEEDDYKRINYYD